MSVDRVHVCPEALKVLSALLDHSAVHRTAPTLRALADTVGLRSTATVHQHLWSLRRAGLVDWEDGKQATLRATVASVR